LMDIQCVWAMLRGVLQDFAARKVVKLVQ